MDLMIEMLLSFFGKNVLWILAGVAALVAALFLLLR